MMLRLGLRLKPLTASRTPVRWGSAISQPVFYAGDQWERRRDVAMVDENGTHTYGQVSVRSRMVANALQAELGTNPEKSKKISFLCGNNVNFVDAMWGIWRWGHVCVPLDKSQSMASLEFTVKDSNSLAVITTKEFVDKVHPFMKNSDKKLLILEEVLDSRGKEAGAMSVDIFDDDTYNENSDAMMIYTSGSVENAKGVVLSHKNIIAQINAMLDSWGWNRQDTILNVLPLHRTHGMLNCLLCPLAVGAKIIMMPKFNSQKCWEILVNRNETSPYNDVNVFMSVPTVYAKLIQKYHEPEFKAMYNPGDIKESILEKFRLMVTGSSAMPMQVMQEWRQITGQQLLERYGKTELGMVLSDPIEVEARKAGFVGVPMPGVQVRVVKPGTSEVLLMGDNDGTTILKQEGDTISGELQVKGAGVFKRYHNHPKDTAKEFTKDKWYMTNDMVEFVPSDGKDGYDGAYKILGNLNVDLIKTGGFRVSAQDVERVLLEHESIGEIAIIGVEDLTYGQKVAAVVSWTEGAPAVELNDIREWAKDKMPSYSLPTLLKVMDKLPRNVMGKVNKKEIAKVAFPAGEAADTKTAAA